MREIKFRAWDRKNKEMRPVQDLRFDIDYGLKEINLDTYVFFKERFNDIELMQYIGLKDKDGKEIYEGDIIKMKHPIIAVGLYSNKQTDTGEIHEVTGKVEYRRSCFWCGDELLLGLIKTEFEVIGNIYENSELLKDVEDGPISP